MRRRKKFLFIVITLFCGAVLYGYKRGKQAAEDEVESAERVVLGGRKFDAQSNGHQYHPVEPVAPVRNVVQPPGQPAPFNNDVQEPGQPAAQREDQNRLVALHKNVQLRQAELKKQQQLIDQQDENLKNLQQQQQLQNERWKKQQEDSERQGVEHQQRLQQLKQQQQKIQQEPPQQKQAPPQQKQAPPQQKQAPPKQKQEPPMPPQQQPEQKSQLLMKQQQQETEQQIAKMKQEHANLLQQQQQLLQQQNLLNQQQMPQQPNIQEKPVPQQQPNFQQPQLPQQQPNFQQPQLPQQQPNFQQPQRPQQQANFQEQQLPQQLPNFQQQQLPQQPPQFQPQQQFPQQQQLNFQQQQQPQFQPQQQQQFQPQQPQFQPQQPQLQQQFQPQQQQFLPQPGQMQPKPAGQVQPQQFQPQQAINQQPNVQPAVVQQQGIVEQGVQSGQDGDAYMRNLLKDKIHLSVVTCGDRVEETLIMLKSAVVFTQAPMHFHIFTEDQLKEEISTKLNSWPPAFRRKFAFSIYPITFPPGEDPNEWKKVFKLCATQRLFLPDLLLNVDSVLYVDTDIMFMRPLEKIWVYLKEFNATQFAAMTPEHEIANIGWYNRFGRHPYYGLTGLNSGVMLMNLTRMRKFGWTAKIVPLYKEYKRKITWGDQDLINILFHFHPEGVYVYPCAWNFRPDACMYSLNCHSIKDLGVSILHGNRGVYHNEKQLSFRAVYEAFRDYEFGTDIETGLIQGVKQRFANPNLVNMYCTKALSEPLIDTLRQSANFANPHHMNNARLPNRT